MPIQMLSPRIWSSLLLFFISSVFEIGNGARAAAQSQPFEVTTYHYDSLRTGWNAKETRLSPDTIKNGSFGLLKTAPLDEQVDAQPLVVSGLEIAGQAHEVAYVVTENNTVYAIDASTGSVLGQPRHLGAPVSAGRGGIISCGNNASVIGIGSTPVIDRGANALYLIAFMSRTISRSTVCTRLIWSRWRTRPLRNSSPRRSRSATAQNTISTRK